MRKVTFAAACGLALSYGSQDARAQAAPDPAELVFTRVTPCRAFVTTAALAANQARTFVVSGTSAAFTAQGGPSAGCGVPASAEAVAISLTSFGSAGAGHLRATAFGEPITGTQVQSYRTNETDTAGAIAGVKSGKLTIKAYAASTKVAGDITGYYAPQIQADVNADGSVLSKTSRVLSVTRFSEGIYSISVDRIVVGCAITLTTAGSRFNISGSTSYTGVDVYVRDVTNTGAPYSDVRFYFTATC